jgi:hypothetical protein
MTKNDVALLRESIDKIVRFRCTDGEIILAKVHTIDVEDEEIVYDLMTTTDESKYEKRDEQPAYLIHFRDIVSVEAATLD